ncbi:hypothetical protein QQZ08_009224 [Neonectria magnoliae]|uniref:Glycerate dehydrogenase n=1 Tax=Neonectria magnoliae TaxID=2732573 RepID=A0ABR1HPF2_9HYPO
MAQSSNSSNGHHHVIVLLEKFFPLTPVLDLPAPQTYELREYAHTRPDQLVERIRDAEIIIRTVLPIRAEALTKAASPNLQMIAVVGSGTDSIDLDACRTRGIVVTNTPHCNTSAVAEHALGMYFAVRRSIPRSHRLTQAGEWAKRGMLLNVLHGPDDRAPRTCRDEVVGILGYGGVGQKVAALSTALGMRVLLSGRKGVPESLDRTPFDQVICTASVLILCLPKTPDTIDYIATSEFEAMQSDTVLINVSRGGIVDEEALVRALKKGEIAGAATDVFLKEPASEKDSPLLGTKVQDLNLVTTPHTAWVAEETNANYLKTLEANVVAFVAGKPINVVR